MRRIDPHCPAKGGGPASLALAGLLAACAREPQPQPPPTYGAPGQVGPWSPVTALQPLPAPPAPPPSAPDVQQTCVDSVNRHRQTLGLAPLARWRDGEACTAREASTDAQRNAPHGSFGACHESAQNVCPGWDGPPSSMTEPCVQSMWNEGPGADFGAHGHYLNMTNREYRAVACGYAVLPNGSVWLIQNFTR